MPEVCGKTKLTPNASSGAICVVELDGSQHAENLEYDVRRDRFLKSAGFQILRFWNNDVMGRTEEVLDTIYAALHRDSDPSAPAGHLPI